MPKFTPPLSARGIYTLAAPFPNISDKIYQAVAIRSFRDYVDLGESAFDKVYAPNGLTQEDYDTDAAQQANIITLASADHPTLLVPDTYITKYPDLEWVEYSNVVVSAALGAIPDTLDLSLLQSQIAGVISDVIGVTPVVRIHAYADAGVVTYAQHDINEMARQASITNRTTDRARYRAALAEKTALEARIVDLEDAIASMGDLT